MTERDEILQELRDFREDFARRFNYDLDRMFDYLLKVQAARLRKTRRQRSATSGHTKAVKGPRSASKPGKRRRAA